MTIMKKAKVAPKRLVFKGFLLDYIKGDREFGFWNPESGEYIVIKSG